MSVNMVNWPHGHPNYHSTGEGMFAWLVVLEPENTTGEACSVDVHAFLSEPDCRVPYRMAEPQLWENGDFHDRARTRLHAAREALERNGEGGLAKSLTGLRGEDELSVPLRAVVFLGATWPSMAHDNGSGYFEVAPDDLTSTGRAVYDALAKEHGESAVHILTFLDT